MYVIRAYFDKKVNQCSPVQDDFERKVNYDDAGNEIVTWQKVDYSALQKEAGTVENWSLDSLLKAGINPNFPIHTGNPTRLEGVDVVNQVAAYADSLLNDGDFKSE